MASPLSGPAAADLCLVGAPLDTGNLGVSALGVSTLAAIARRGHGLSVTLFDNGTDVRHVNYRFEGGVVGVTHRGMWLSRRVHRPESLWQMYLSSLIGADFNPNVKSMARSSAVWDVSGGDSFSDMYGAKRFAQVTLPKRIALRCARNLVLLPQTYGPFREPSNRRMAHRILVGAAEVWTRDKESHYRLVELLGRDYDPSRHRRTVDLAFTLPVAEPSRTLIGRVANWLDDDQPVIGINVSGLLTWPGATKQFGLAADHESVLEALVRRALSAGLRVVLIPHVMGVIGEVDNVACRRLASRFDPGAELEVLPDTMDASTTKWVISRLEWLTGARMHATIAALSSLTPVTGIAYSDKMHGVFATCGVRDQVADARVLGRTDLLDALWAGFDQREEIRARLGQHVPATVERAEATFDHLVGRLDAT